MNRIDTDGSVVLSTEKSDESVFTYAVRPAPLGVDIPTEGRGDEVSLPVAGSTSATEVHLTSGSAGYCLWGLTEAQVIADVLAQFEQHRRT